MDKLQVYVRPHPDGYEVEATLIEREHLPPDIFSHENTGTATLGDFTGVVSALDISKRSTWTGVAIPTFGNKFVLTDSVRKVFSSKETADSFAANIVSGAKKLKDDLAKRPTSSNIYTL